MHSNANCPRSNSVFALADYALFFLAKESAISEAFGVDVKLSLQAGTLRTIQMLASGNVEAAP